MATMQYQGPGTNFDPSKQTYMEYLNQLTGFNQPQSPFPAETSGPPPMQAPKPNATAQASQQAGNLATSAALGNQMLPSASGAEAVAASAPAVAAGAEAAAGGSAALGVGAPAAGSASFGGMSVPMGTYGGMQAATPGLLSGGAAIPTAAGYGAGALAGYYSLTGAQEIADGGKMNLAEQTALALPTFGLSYLYNPVRGMIKSGKHQDQRNRDDVRNYAQESGWFGNNFEVPLQQSGITLDMGKDGGFTYQNADGSTRPVYNLDWDNDPLVGQGVGWLKPLGLVLAKGDPKLADDFTAQLYNELTKDGQVKDLDSLRKRAVELYNQFKLKPSFVAETINMMEIDPGERDASLAAIDSLRPGRKPQVAPGVQPIAGHSKPSMSPQPEAPKPAAMGTGATTPKPIVRPNEGRPAPQQKPEEKKPQVRGLFRRAG